jgi:hypothetical protein
MFIPGAEALEDGELRVTVLGGGNPWNTRAQASASVMVEVGNAERDILVFDLGSGSLANYASLKLPVNALNFDQLPPTPGKKRVAFQPVAVPPPAWWAEALIPLD